MAEERIGKTYLIDKFFGDKYDFYMTGIYEGTRKEQLANFAHQLEFYSHKEQKNSKRLDGGSVYASQVSGDIKKGKASALVL